MKYLLTCFCMGACCLNGFSQDSAPKFAIIPVPVSITPGSGTLTLPAQVTVFGEGKTDPTPVIASLKTGLEKTAGIQISKSTDAAQATIVLSAPKNGGDSLGKEGYQLSVGPKQIRISANGGAGFFYGVQTLLQLLPAGSASVNSGTHSWSLPVVEITDYPRFGWRGLMLDVARHFFTVEDVKKYIDVMAMYKFNLLHWHLTDDEGWRIEIKGYPMLTEVGAYNAKRVGYFGTFAKPDASEPRTYGGFYTQEQIKDVVQYAKERYIDVMPEVDVPGHSLAAVASYPELSCTPEANTYKVRSGEEIMDWSHGHPPIALLDNTLCPANERVYGFLDTVVTQLAALFPFEYIHMGGDECPKNYWAKTPAIQALMKKKKLKNMMEVQSYFTKRLEKIVMSKGKKFMGWDEILEGGLAPNAVVMSWRGIKGGIEAAKQGHEVVMSPTTFAYIDYMQGDPITEPKVYATLRLNKSYEFEPVPDGVDPKLIKGGQANLWSEQIYNLRTAEYMTWPRGWAIAESVWSPKEKKNFNDFFARAEQHFARFDSAEIKYSRASYDPIFNISKKDSGLMVKLSTEAPGIDIYYSFDNSFPDRFYPKYSDVLSVPKEASMLKVITYKGKEKVGRMITMPMAEIKKRADQKVNYP